MWIIVALALLAFSVLEIRGCTQDYKERFCSLNEKNRRLEGIRMEVLRAAINRQQGVSAELKECYKTLAQTPIFASDLKLMALLTANRNFRLKSFFDFEKLEPPYNFHNAITQLFLKEYLAFMRIEIGMEDVKYATRSMKDNYEKHLQMNSKQTLTSWKTQLRDESAMFISQSEANTDAENELSNAYAVFMEIYNALGEEDYASVPVGVRAQVRGLMKLHKKGYDDLMKLVQTVEKWTLKTSEVIKSITKECELRDIRSYREKECSTRHNEAAEMLEVIEDFVTDYDNVTDTYIKNYYTTSPRQLLIVPDEDLLDDKQVSIERNCASISRELQQRFDMIMRKHDTRKAQQLNDYSCYQQLIKEKNIDKICKRQSFGNRSRGNRS